MLKASEIVPTLHCDHTISILRQRDNIDHHYNKTRHALGEIVLKAKSNKRDT